MWESVRGECRECGKVCWGVREVKGEVQGCREGKGSWV